MAKSGANWFPTAKQVKVAQLLADPSDRRTKQSKLKEAGVPSRTFYHWMEDKRYLKFLSDQVDLYTDGELPEVWRALINQCVRGDTSAIKLYFEMKGKYKQNNIGSTTDQINQNIQNIANLLNRPAQNRDISEFEADEKESDKE